MYTQLYIKLHILTHFCLTHSTNTNIQIPFTFTEKWSLCHLVLVRIWISRET